MIFPYNKEDWFNYLNLNDKIVEIISHFLGFTFRLSSCISSVRIWSCKKEYPSKSPVLYMPSNWNFIHCMGDKILNLFHTNTAKAHFQLVLQILQILYTQTRKLFTHHLSVIVIWTYSLGFKYIYIFNIQIFAREVKNEAHKYIFYSWSTIGVDKG